ERRVRLPAAKELGRGLRLLCRPSRQKPLQSRGSVMLPWLWLGACILLSSTIEAVTGFGSIVIALSLGALLLPIASMLPVLVPLNIFMTGTIAWKNRHHIDKALLLKLILPLMAAGTLAGYLLRPWLGESLLKTLLGVLIIWFAAR